MHDLNASGDSELKIGSLFSGYGGLDLAVEHVFNAKTVWFSELNEPVAPVFSRHWPEAPNLGDITTCALASHRATHENYSHWSTGRGSLRDGGTFHDFQEVRGGLVSCQSANALVVGFAQDRAAKCDCL